MMGRITQSMINTQLVRNLNTNLSKMSNYQDQASTGRKINRPSDDPVGLSYAMRYRSDITANEQYSENVDSALSWLDYGDSMLAQAGEALQRIRELSVQGATGSNPKTAMDAYKAEILQLTDQLVVIGNSQFNGKYVFNGQQTDVAPYSKDVKQVPVYKSLSGSVNVGAANVTTADNTLKIKVNGGQELTVTLPPKAYSGGTGAADFAADLQTAINSASSASVSVSADSDGKISIASNGTGASAAVEITGGTLAYKWLNGGTDLTQLTGVVNADSTSKKYYIAAQNSDTDPYHINVEIATGVRIPINMTGQQVFGGNDESDNLFKVLNNVVNAFENNDSTAVSNVLGQLDSRLNKFLEMRADLGARVSRVELSEERLKDIDINVRTLLTKTEDVDMAELITKLKSSENVYQASLSIGAKIISPSLVDFLR